MTIMDNYYYFSVFFKRMYNDIKFRFLRTEVLNQGNYKEIMLAMFKEKNFDYKSEIKKLFLSDSNLRELHKNYHLIGLHSHNHPEKIANLKFEGVSRYLADKFSKHGEISNNKFIGAYKFFADHIIEKN